MLIAYNGYKKSGKDTTFGFQRAALEASGTLVEERKFARNLRLFIAGILGVRADLTDDQIVEIMDVFKDTGVLDASWGNKPDGVHLTGREVMQNVGHEARKVFGENFWIDQILPNPATLGWVDPGGLMDITCGGVDLVGITDLRYPNEAERVRQIGGVVVEIVRPGLESDGHQTEQKLPRHLVDHIIVNDGTKEDLERKALALLGELDLV